MSGCTETGKRLQILLSTYNGAQYLKEQLESYRPIAEILPYRVLIRDDGSADGTKAILEEYAATGNVEVVYGENVGLNASYQWLIEHSDPACDYFAISDQDDRWLPNKLAVAIQALEQTGTVDDPLLFASQSILTDEDMTPTRETLQPRRKLTFYNAMVQNPCPGHTQVMTRPLLELLRRYHHADIDMFDWWVYLVAAAFGTVVFSSTATVLHRQHGNNTVGYGKTKYSILIGRVIRVFRGDGKKVSRQLKAFLTCAGSTLPALYRTELELFLRGQVSYPVRLRYVFTGKAYRQSRMDSFLFRCIYLFGGYAI